MKTITTFFFFCIFTLMILPRISEGQTITINSVSKTNLCQGEPISVTFTVTGAWGHKNAFTLQQSDVNGSFANTFTNLESLGDTLPGIFTITTQLHFPISSKYRIRIIGSTPYTASSDNGSDIAIIHLPYIGKVSTYPDSVIPMTGVPISIRGFSYDDDPNSHITNISWNFGADATPQTAYDAVIMMPADSFLRRYFIHDSITYSTSGDKFVSMRFITSSGCDSGLTIKFHVFDCTKPSIPKNAQIVSTNTTLSYGQGSTFWVNPGVTLYNWSGQRDTIYCEGGSTITNHGEWNVYYLKAGASYTSDVGENLNTLIYANGVSISDDARSDTHDTKLLCPDLDFNYTNAPPNKAFPQLGVNSPDGVANAIALSPNPTSGMISISDVPQSVMNISVLNLLGAQEMKIVKPNSSDMQLDLGKLLPGVYYIRFAMPGTVVTKKIVKE